MMKRACVAFRSLEPIVANSYLPFGTMSMLTVGVNLAKKNNVAMSVPGP